jgi:cellulose synthase/poly-beta-1,6-N-acetylglucosamine synthase-like glycosyltransferase
MSGVLTALGWVLAVVAVAPLLVLSLELLAGLWPPRRLSASPSDARIAVLIPAHDEAGGITATLAALFAVAPPGTRVLVVADNCTDATAALAREAGAEVLERHDDANRGKGFALAAGRDHLAQNGPPPEVVLILDADCRLLPGSVEALADAALRGNAPAQAVNLIEADLAAAPMVQVSSFAMLVKNLYRSRGMQRLGGAALLTGTGMAFPWPLIADAKLATGSIVEDLALGIELTAAGHAPRLVGNAGVRSAPAAMVDALAQKTRWEHGFLDTLRRRALPLAGRGLARLSPALLLLGLHLMVPPLALLLVVVGAVLGLLCVLALLGASIGPALALGAVLAFALALLFIGWLVGGRRYLAGRALLRLPFYLLWKLPVYVGFLRKPQASWNRTPRRP